MESSLRRKIKEILRIRWRNSVPPPWSASPLSALYSVDSAFLSPVRSSQTPVLGRPFTSLYAFLIVSNHFHKTPLAVCFLSHSRSLPLFFVRWFGYYIKWLKGFNFVSTLFGWEKRKEGKRLRGRTKISTISSAPELFLFCPSVYNQHARRVRVFQLLFLSLSHFPVLASVLPRVWCHRPAKADSPQSV